MISFIKRILLEEKKGRNIPSQNIKDSFLKKKPHNILKNYKLFRSALVRPLKKNNLSGVHRYKTRYSYLFKQKHRHQTKYMSAKFELMSKRFGRPHQRSTRVAKRVLMPMKNYLYKADNPKITQYWNNVIARFGIKRFGRLQQKRIRVSKGYRPMKRYVHKTNNLEIAQFSTSPIKSFSTKRFGRSQQRPIQANKVEKGYHNSDVFKVRISKKKLMSIQKHAREANNPQITRFWNNTIKGFGPENIHKTEDPKLRRDGNGRFGFKRSTFKFKKRRRFRRRFIIKSRIKKQKIKVDLVKERAKETHYASTFFERFHYRYIIQQVNIKSGNKAKATKIVDNLILYLKKQYMNRDTNTLLEQILNNAKVLVHFRGKRVGSMVYQIPVDLREYKAKRTVARWLTSQKRFNSGKNSFENIREELMLLMERRGAVHKKGVETLKEAHSGIPYLRYLRRKSVR